MPPAAHRVAVVALLALLSACATLMDAEGTATAVTPAPSPAILAPYLETLAQMTPGDPLRQQAELDATLAAAEQTRSSADTLRYALALGSAGHADSNPVEAKRLIAELLAGPHTLDRSESVFAGAFLREFDARVALYADLARLREESEQQLKSLDATAERRADALAAENRSLKRALAEAERKLKAVEEMERSLLEQAGDTGADTPPRP